MTEDFKSAAYPSNPTVPSQMPIGYVTPQVPQGSSRKPPISPEEADARRDQFYELTLGKVVEAVSGVYTGDGDAFGQLVTWATDLIGDIGGLLDGIVAGLQNWFLVGDIIEVISGREDGDLNDLGTIWNGWISDVRQTIDDIVGALFGWTGTGWSHDDATQALSDITAAVAQLGAAVAALQNDRNNQAVNGTSAVEDFSLAPDSPSLPAAFTVTYSGSGTSTWGIAGGRTVVNIAYNADRDAIARYTSRQSSTDYQSIGTAFATAPEWGNSSIAAYNFLYGRMNATGTDYVYARLGKYSIELGCVVAGVKTVFASVTSGFSLKANAVYWLRCGTVGGLRIFQIIEGNAAILTHTEVGTTSQVDASHRYVGMGVHVDTTSWNKRSPGQIGAWAFADNQPATVVGSGARMYRTSAANVNASSGNNLLPGSFFSTLAEHTPDITIDTSTGKFTVSIDGWYDIEVRLALSGFTDIGQGVSAIPPFPLSLAIYKNGSLDRLIGDVVRPYPFAQSGDTGLNFVCPEGISASCRIFLQAGEYIQAGYRAQSSKASFFTGDTGGQESYFSIVLANRSLA